MSHAENRRQRMEEIELALLNSPGGLLPSELAQKFGVDRSTIHRDLNEIGQRTALEQCSETGRYSINPTTYLRNVRLSNAEALTIYIALRRFIRQTSHAPGFFATAIQKIASALRHPALATNLGLSSVVLESERQASAVQTEVWNTLLQSWYEQVVVEVDYQGLQRHKTETHVFEPYLFEPAVLSHGVYVIGWSHTRGELRTFKIDRIHRVRRTGRFFQRNHQIQPDYLLRHAWGVWYGKELTWVVLRFDPAVAARVRETIWHPSQVVEDQADGSLLWSVEVAGTLELVSWIRGWGHEVEVLAPATLRERIANDLRKAAERYKQPT